MYPTTDEFDVADFSGAPNTIHGGSNSLLEMGEYKPTAPLVHGNGLVGYASALGHQSSAIWSLTLPLPDTQDYTFDIGLELLGGLGAGKKLFIRLVTEQGVNQGLLLDSSGFRIASSYEDQSTVAVSDPERVVHQFLQSGRGRFHIRGVFEYSSRILRLFIGQTPVAGMPVRFHELGSSRLRPGVASSSFFDLQVWAPSGDDLGVLIHSLQIASTLLIPPRDILFTLVAPKTATTSEAIRLGYTVHTSGVAVLEQEWSVTPPVGAKQPKMGGGSYSMALATHTPGVGDPEGALAVRILLKAATFNDWVLRIEASETHTAPAAGVKPTDRMVVVRCPSSGGDITVPAEVVAQAISSVEVSVGSDNAFVDVEVLASGSFLDAGDYAFSGGKSSSASEPLLIAPSPGLYEVRLRLRSDYGWSDWETASISVSVVTALAGHRPNMEPILQYLPDYYKKVEALEVITELWSAGAQVIADVAGTLWQRRLAESIKTLPATYIRRNQPVELGRVLGTDARVVLSEVAAASLHVIGGYSIEGEHVVATVGGTRGQLLGMFGVNMALLITDVLPPRVAHFTTGGANRWVTKQPVGVVLKKGYAGTLVDEGANVVSLQDLAIPEWDIPPASFGPRVLFINGEQYPVSGTVGKKLQVIAPGLEEAQRVEWSLCLLSISVQAVAMPFISVPVMEPVQTPAVVALESNAWPTYVLASVVAQAPGVLYIDWASIPASGDLPWSAISSVLYIRSLKRGNVKLPYLRHIPTLGETPLAQTIIGGRDFVVEDGGVWFLPTDTLPIAYVVDESVRFATPIDKELADALPGERVYFQNGLGSATVLAAGVQGAKLSRPVPVSTTELFVYKLYGASPEAGLPPVLWAEHVEYHNYTAISNNFGSLVGLDAAWLEELAGTTLDKLPINYLSLIRAVYFAVLHGPTVGNILSALEAAVGAIVAVEETNLVAVTAPVSRLDGVLITSTRDSILLESPHSVGAKLQAKKNTDEPVEVYPIGSGIPFAEHTASVIPAGRAPAHSMAILDLVSDPDDWMLALGESSSARANTFAVSIPVRKLVASWIPALFRRIVDTLKPARTKYHLVGSLPLADTVGVVEEYDTEITLYIQDSITSPLMHSSSDTEALGFPVLETTTRGEVNGDTWDAADVLEKYESGYVVGAIDDYSGDGSLNQYKNLMHFVNSVDSDIDVCRSRLVVPVYFGNGDTSLAVGELVEVIDDDVPTVVCWGTESPVILYIWPEPHPGLPFGTHNYTGSGFLVLGFATRVSGNDDSGVEERLFALSEVYSDSAVHHIRGKTSLRECQVIGSPKAIYEEDDNRGVLLRHISDLDAGEAVVPHDAFYMTQSFYVPVEGITIADLVDKSPILDPDSVYYKGVAPRRGSYYPGDDQNTRFQPDFNPGLFTGFDLDGLDADIGEGAATVDNFLWRYGVANYNAILSAGHAPSTTDPVGNIWLGVTVSAAKDAHGVHGYRQHDLREPVAEVATIELAGEVLWVRVEGWFFIEPAAGEPVPSYNIPTEYSGTGPSSWLYLVGSAGEFPLAQVLMEKGTSADRTVLGADGAVQTSDGHVLTGDVPLSVPDGIYSVLVRVFYPWKPSALSATQVWYADSLTTNTITVVQPEAISGFGDGGFGDSGFGE